MKIINKRKFVRSISVISVLIVLIILLLINTSFSHTEIKYKTIEVVSGDKLWNIAKYEQQNNIYFENKDIRYIVDEIKYINNLNTSFLNIGDELKIPII